MASDDYKRPGPAGPTQIEAQPIQPATELPVGSVWRWSDRAVRWAERIFSVGAGVAMTGVLLLVFADVVLRYFFGSGMQGSHRLVELTLMPALVYLAFSYTLREDAHPRIVLIYDRLTSRVQGYISTLTGLIVAVFTGVATYAVVQRALGSYATYGGSVTGGIHLEPYYGEGLVALGLALATVRALWMALASPKVAQLKESSADIESAGN